MNKQQLKEKLDRIRTLENTAKDKYTEYSNWSDVIAMLHDDDKAEYWELAKEVNLFGDDYEYE